MFRRWFKVFLALAIPLLFPLAGQAQHPGGDSGDYSILSAQYGTERHHVDVTRRLQQEARRDRTFRVSNGLLGVDPDPGVLKALRIYARGPHGHEHMFEYREGALVDGALFRGWGRGDWATGADRWSGKWNVDEGQFTILKAEYGTDRRRVDVTERLQTIARKDRIFRISNEILGTDPVPGVLKALRIYARGPQGREQLFEYREGAVMDGGMFRSWGRGDWANGADRGGGSNSDEGEYLILSAQYGTERKHVDVTERLKAFAKRDRTFRVTNDCFGVDPDFGHVKTLRIYARGADRRERMFEYREGGVVDGSRFRAWGRGEWGSGKDRWSGRWEGGR